MKIAHKTHGWFPERADDPEWGVRVEREATQHTTRTETAWHKARRRLERAVEKAEAAENRQGVARVRIARLWQVVEQRREELKAIERLAHGAPAGSQHRGRGSYRGVSTGEAL